jgi:hypothetical protein
LLNAPELPRKLETPALLAPNVSSEAEQVSKLLTGQPLATTVSLPSLNTITSANSALAALQASGLPGFAAGSTTTPAQAGGSPIVVTPSPIVVISPPPTDLKKKQQHNKSRMHQMFNRLGNRISQAVPQ